MGRYWKIFWLVLFVAVSLRSQQAPDRPRYRPIAVVTRVEVSCREGSYQLRRVYTRPEKMEKILNYLRLQKNMGAPMEDPERMLGAAYRILVETSDGTSHIYQQRLDRYLSRDYKPWQKIESEQAGQLRRILQMNRTDERI